MNRKMTTYILGRMLGVEALVLFIPAMVSVIYGEDDWKAFLLTSAILLLLYVLWGAGNRRILRFMEKMDLSLLRVHGFCGPFLAHCHFIFQEKSHLM